MIFQIYELQGVTRFNPHGFLLKYNGVTQKDRKMRKLTRKIKIKVMALFVYPLVLFQRLFLNFNLILHLLSWLFKV